MNDPDELWFGYNALLMKGHYILFLSQPVGGTADEEFKWSTEEFKKEQLKINLK